MASELIQVCDACGARDTQVQESLGIGPFLHSPDRPAKPNDVWANLTTVFASFDLCPACMRTVMGLLGLKIDDHQRGRYARYMNAPAMRHMRRHLHAVPTGIPDLGDLDGTNEDPSAQLSGSLTPEEMRAMEELYDLHARGGIDPEPPKAG